MEHTAMSWQPPASREEQIYALAMLRRIERYDLDGRKMLKTAAKIGIDSEEGINTAMTWAENEVKNLDRSEFWTMQRKSIRWRFSFMGAAALILGWAFMIGLFNAGYPFIGLIFGVGGTAHAVFRFAGYHPRHVMTEWWQERRW